FVKQIREVLAEADARSLVLVDELGAGTDPDEGAALARAILETLAERGALVVATTHLEPLRAFASSEPRARNASVEFDTRTLAPPPARARSSSGRRRRRPRCSPRSAAPSPPSGSGSSAPSARGRRSTRAAAGCAT